MVIPDRAVARPLIGGCIFIYSGPARLVSFEIKLPSKEVSRGEHKYMNIPPPPPISVLATALIPDSNPKRVQFTLDHRNVNKCKYISRKYNALVEIIKILMYFT